MIPLLQAPPLDTSLSARAARLAQLELTYRFQPDFRLPDADALLEEPARAAEPPPATTPAQGWPAHLVQLGARPLLSPAEERQRFLRMNYARYRADQLRRRLDTACPDAGLIDQIERLLAIAQHDRDQIVAANTRLVIALVRRCGVDRQTFDELLSEGLETLLRSVDQFDPGRGFRFSTYATTAVRRTLLRALRRVAQQRQRQHQLTEEAARAAVWRAEDAEADPVFGDWAMVCGGQEEARPLGAAAQDNPLPPPSLRELMAVLTPRERLVLARRYGLDGARTPQTLQSLARELGVCKERVRQIELRAREKLRRQLEAHGARDVRS
jgi:RNA polymerase sigma factor (sigma-70 family)